MAVETSAEISTVPKSLTSEFSRTPRPPIEIGTAATIAASGWKQMK